MKTRKETTPTPTLPWKSVKARTYVHIQDANGNCVASCTYETKEANAALIVKAVNMHDTYAKAINEIKEQLMYADNHMAMIEAIERAVDKAIAKAEGGR